MRYLNCLLQRLGFLVVIALWLQTQHTWGLTTTKTLRQLLLGDSMTSHRATAPPGPTVDFVPTNYRKLLTAIHKPEGATTLASSFFRRYWESPNKRPRTRSRIMARNGISPFSETERERDPEAVGVLGLDNHDFITSTLDKHRTRPGSPARSSTRADPPRRHPGRQSPFYIRQLTPTPKGIPGMMRSSYSVSNLQTLMQGMHDLQKAGRR